MGQIVATIVILQLAKTAKIVSVPDLSRDTARKVGTTRKVGTPPKGGYSAKNVGIPPEKLIHREKDGNTARTAGKPPEKWVYCRNVGTPPERWIHRQKGG